LRLARETAQLGEGHVSEQGPRDAPVPGGVSVRAGACLAMGYKS